MIKKPMDEIHMITIMEKTGRFMYKVITPTLEIGIAYAEMLKTDFEKIGYTVSKEERKGKLVYRINDTVIMMVS